MLYCYVAQTLKSHSLLYFHLRLLHIACIVKADTHNNLSHSTLYGSLWIVLSGAVGLKCTHYLKKCPVFLCMYMYRAPVTPTHNMTTEIVCTF